MKPLYFYSKSECPQLSNFYYAPIRIDGEVWRTNEHYFQAMKFKNPEYREEIRLSRTPAGAKRLGQSRSYRIHDDWDNYRMKVMKKALYAKFTQHKKLKDLLLSTGERELIEKSADTFWGCGTYGNGQNKLGKLLMLLRKKLREDE